ncbi:sensor histidine kinase [Streptomyces sp. 3MP-14]|uniref:histidine kinase n=1 Tax=Streptomyces mimosae TaxID=2586635 RepID=A0A5N6A4Y5_9ACTN|nr:MULTISPECIES: sensor histidine kinase [Streptomyces]KAB8163857.1 sensor histidine kinase [Streptomyces mimosae]KAB8175300.1 sensor histidine kinase [Streptomyces sp. 3MP-14]
MNRLYDFLRRHPTGVDGCWAFVLVFTSVVVVTLPTEGGYEGPVTGALVVTLAMGVVVLLRRRWPEQMLGLAILTGLGQIAANITPLPANFALMVIIFTVAARPERWPSRLGLLTSVAAPALATVRWPDAQEPSLANRVIAGIFLTGAFCLAWVLGDSLRTRRAYYAELEARADRLERERETQARMAVAAERARIARELHDVVAHNVSVMVVQADGAAYVLDSAPDQCRNALRTISGTGRQALAEMRRLLGVLRTEDSAVGAQDYVPQPGVEQLAELVDQVRDTGLAVDFRISGDPRPLPSGVELTAYRIVQEALTNTRKHGGPDAGATVTLEYGGDALTVLAEDDGRGAQQELYEGRGVDGQGHGLIGMRERVGMVNGLLVAGPRPGGGFRISATLPLNGGQ